MTAPGHCRTCGMTGDRHWDGCPETPLPDFTGPIVTGHDLGPDDMALVVDPQGVWRFRHRCNRGDRGTIICAPALDPTLHHVDTGRAAAPTVTPSIHCPDCNTHGYISDGRWLPC